MKRGFKTKAEQSANEARVTLGLRQFDRLDPWAYAESLGVEVLIFEDLGLEANHVLQLTKLDPDSWSGMTIQEAGLTAIVLNPANAKTRQCSTLMHELAHFQLRHLPANVTVSSTGVLLLSEYDEGQEEEADWLAGAMLVPRQALVHFSARGEGPPEIAKRFGISVDMCQWRLRMTGVNAQLARRRGLSDR